MTARAGFGSENAKLFRIGELRYSKDTKEVRMSFVSLWKLKRLTFKSQRVLDSLDERTKD
jgi:hypothetical protein